MENLWGRGTLVIRLSVAYLDMKPSKILTRKIYKTFQAHAQPYEGPETYTELLCDGINKASDTGNRMLTCYKAPLMRKCVNL